MADLSELTPTERAKRYREMAGKARVEAADAQEDARHALLLVAVQWERLAETLAPGAAHSIQAAEEAVQPGTGEKLAALKPPPTEPDKT